MTSSCVEWVLVVMLGEDDCMCRMSMTSFYCASVMALAFIRSMSQRVYACHQHSPLDSFKISICIRMPPPAFTTRLVQYISMHMCATTSIHHSIGSIYQYAYGCHHQHSPLDWFSARSSSLWGVEALPHTADVHGLPEEGKEGSQGKFSPHDE